MDELQVGRELDALVAEKVMGWPVYRAKHSKTTGEWIAGPIINQWQYLVLGDELRFYDRTNENLLGRRWHPSEDIAAAWEVITKMREMGFGFTVSDNGNRFAEHIDCRFWSLRDDRRRGIAIEDDAPVAICRAALEAVEQCES